MYATKYQVTAVDLDLKDPDLRDIEDGAVRVEFNPGSEPEFDDELGALVGFATLDVELYAHDGIGQPPADTVGDPDAKLGDISVSFHMILEGEPGGLDEVIETWSDDGYRALDADVRFHLESGIGTEIMNPLSDLIDSSFRGLLPHTRFTPGESNGSHESR